MWPADADHINQALPASSRGTFGNNLKAYLEAHGFSAFVFNGKDLDHHLAKGRPLVVCLAPNGPDGPLHYVVVVGAGETESTLQVAEFCATTESWLQTAVVKV
jgi:hypothetical protein